MDGVRILNNELKNCFEKRVQLSQERKNEAINYWKPIEKAIVDYVCKSDDRFSSLLRIGTGSYYEKAQVNKEPYEFDVMLVINNFEVGYISQATAVNFTTDHNETEPPLEFTRVYVGKKTEWQRDGCVDAQGMLNAYKIKAVFERLVKDAIRALQNSTDYSRYVAVKSNGPAVALQITNIFNLRKYSIDLTLAVKCVDWPRQAEEWIRRSRNGWPNQQLVQEIWGEGCYLVAKKPKGINIPEQEKEVLWRLSFSGAEKKLLLHGAQGEEIGCRRQVLRFMKAFRDRMEWVKLTSYHLKTIMLHEYEAHPNPNDWSSECLSFRFISFLEKLEFHLWQANCPHYFIEGVNLLERVSPEKCSEMAANVRLLKFVLVMKLLTS